MKDISPKLSTRTKAFKHPSSRIACSKDKPSEAIIVAIVIGGCVLFISRPCFCGSNSKQLVVGEELSGMNIEWASEYSPNDEITLYSVYAV